MDQRWYIVSVSMLSVGLKEIIVYLVTYGLFNLIVTTIFTINLIDDVLIGVLVLKLEG